VLPGRQPTGNVVSCAMLSWWVLGRPPRRPSHQRRPARQTAHRRVGLFWKMPVLMLGLGPPRLGEGAARSRGPVVDRSSRGTSRSAGVGNASVRIGAPGRMGGLRSRYVYDKTRPSGRRPASSVCCAAEWRSQMRTAKRVCERRSRAPRQDYDYTLRSFRGWNENDVCISAPRVSSVPERGPRLDPVCTAVADSGRGLRRTPDERRS